MPPLRLRNPHSVIAVLDRRPQDVYQIHCPDREQSDDWAKVRRIAEEIGIPVQAVKPDANRSKKGKQRRHAAAEAVIKPLESTSVNDMLASPDEENGIWVGLDTVQDPHNVGSIFRSAAFFGVSGIVTTQDRNAPISYTVYDVSSGGVEYVPFSIETNLSRTIDRFKEAGIWVLGTSEHAEKPISEIQRDRSWLVILGNEENGLRRLTADKCDDLVSIPRSGQVGSLNVSVAAGITLAHLTSH
ncbi:MAG: 23S rRNA (guanosine(2251)-2'-O)-methyltransferase RlmB [Gemmatimonadetes bacterium]|nr:23S rRNA (guanosine(2251)-2'-O)-methyltransferase RlmB [Gemmatimonadota bacterium]|tara:strand:- start:297 stop:1025 length:729 start_codon:yes stop_codon:yes gene_type:complete